MTSWARPCDRGGAELRYDWGVGQIKCTLWDLIATVGDASGGLCSNCDAF